MAMVMPVSVPTTDPYALRILDQGDDWVAVVKPRGLSTVPARNTDEVPLIARVEMAGFADVRTTGRLDRAAGGIVLFALGAAAQRRIAAHWARPNTLKLYLARTLAAPVPAAGSANEAIGRGRKGRMRLGGEGARAARTDYTTLQPDAAPSPTANHHSQASGATPAWVVARLATGRRHQIRLHLAARGAPIAGDTMYLQAAAAVGGYAGAAPAPTPPDTIDLWCVRLCLPHLGVDLAWMPDEAAALGRDARALPLPATGRG